MVTNHNLKLEGKEPKGAPARRRSWLGKAGIKFLIDALAFLTFLVCTLTGWVLMALRPGEDGPRMGLLNAELFWGIPHFEWANLHNLIGWIFVALVAVHLIMHWHWFAGMCFSALCPGRTCTSKQRPQTEI